MAVVIFSCLEPLWKKKKFLMTIPLCRVVALKKCVLFYPSIDIIVDEWKPTGELLKRELLVPKEIVNTAVLHMMPEALQNFHQVSDSIIWINFCFSHVNYKNG